MYQQIIIHQHVFFLGERESVYGSNQNALNYCIQLDEFTASHI